MESRDFYLIIDSSIVCCYLATKWIKHFDGHPNFRGIIAREERPTESLLQARQAFHAEYGGQKLLTDDMRRQILELYPEEMDETEEAGITLYGIPQYATTHHPETIFLGSNLNSQFAQQWLQETCQDSSPWFFLCVGQVLKPWWMEMAQSQVINTHSAVLPYARGLYAIENVAAFNDADAFRQAAGFTIHYVDAHVDTGPIIRAERIRDPFGFRSIWELKIYTYMTSFACYVKSASDFLSNEETLPAGIIHNPSLRGPNFRRKDFTKVRREQAEAGYLSMKSAVQRTKADQLT